MLIRRLYSIFKNSFAEMDNLIAVCQVTSTANKEQNFQICKSLITNAHKCGAKVYLFKNSHLQILLNYFIVCFLYSDDFLTRRI